MHDFLLRLPRFRAWTLGAGRETGAAQGDAIRNITGHASEGATTAFLSTAAILSGAFTSGASRVNLVSTFPNEGGYDLMFDASRVIPTATENRPANVALPAILYLGLPA